MRQLVTMCAAVLVLATAPLHAQHLGARLQWQPEIADIDSRLQQSVEIEVLGRAAVPALKLLSDATGVSLTVAPEDLTTVGERKLTVISKGLTLKAIMVQLPVALQECHWDIDDSGEKPVYLLHRNSGVAAATEKQTAATRAALQDVYQAERSAALLSRLDAVRQALRMSPRELARLEDTDLILARAAQMPTTREMMEALLSLPDRDMDQFIETGQLDYRYDNAPPGVQRLPQLILELIGQYFTWSESWPPEDRDRLGITIEDMRAEMDSQAQQLAQLSDLTITLSADSEVIGVRTADLGFPIVPPPNQDIGDPPGSFGHFLLAQTGYDYADASDTVRKWVEERQKEKDPDDSHAWEKNLGAEPTDARLLQSISLPGGADVIDTLDVQRAVAEQTGISVLSDFFTGTNVYRAHLRDEMPLWHVLGYLSLRRCEWSFVGNCLVFYDRTWYRDVRVEVPERLLFPLVRKYCAGESTIDDVCALVIAPRRDASAADLLRTAIAPVMPRDLQRLNLNAHDFWAIHTYSLLSEEQCRALRRPEGLAVADLPPAARDTVLSLGTDLLRSVARPTEDLEQASFHLREAAEAEEGMHSPTWVTSILYLEFADGATEEVRFQFPRAPIEITYTPLLYAEQYPQPEDAS